MEEFFRNILTYLRNFLSQYSYFIDGDYYGGLFSKYFSVAGFIIGFIFVLIVYFSSAEEQKKTGFFKVLPFIAVINSCAVLSKFLNATFHQGYSYTSVESLFNAPDNIISGFILTLVICSCYRRFGRQAFLFGIATHGALPFLNFAYIGYMDDISIGIMVVRILLAGFLCLIICHRKYFYTSWIWYFGFHIFLRLGVFLLPLMSELIFDRTLYETTYTIETIIKYFSQFTMDAIIFAVILVFAIVFEKGVLTAKPLKAKTA